MTNAVSALEAVELSRMVRSVAEGIAAAQLGLDLVSLRSAATMASTRVDLDGEPVSLLELGFMPSFYQFADTTIEVKVSISMTEERSEETATREEKSKTEQETKVSASFGWSGFSVSKKTTTTTTTTTVDARFASRFQYSMEASSALRTRIVPVPAPSVLMELARELAAE